MPAANSETATGSPAAAGTGVPSKSIVTVSPGFGAPGKPRRVSFTRDTVCGTWKGSNLMRSRKKMNTNVEVLDAARQARDAETAGAQAEDLGVGEARLDLLRCVRSGRRN